MGGLEGGGVGWAVGAGGVGWAVGAGGEPQAGQSKLPNRNGSAVSSVGDPDRHNSNGGPGLPSESAWHPMQSY